jgi:hypothetical protein
MIADAPEPVSTGDGKPPAPPGCTRPSGGPSAERLGACLRDEDPLVIACRYLLGLSEREAAVHEAEQRLASVLAAPVVASCG